MNWNDPQERLALLEKVGGAEYNRLMDEQREKAIIEVVNGHAIRWTQSRFGLLCMVGNTHKAFQTLKAARTFAATIARGPTSQGNGEVRNGDADI